MNPFIKFLNYCGPSLPISLASTGIVVWQIRASTRDFISGINSMDSRFDRVDSRFNALDSKFDTLDSKFDGQDSKFYGLNMKALSGEKNSVNQEMVDIENWPKLSTEGCNVIRHCIRIFTKKDQEKNN
ncbi:hypothetical protein C7212DRAFT_315169 [Tuber magnatum]|uniref:Uncharacterized protein n=1 Tax=Tuber magnatum TaxID=42249 RepID=A0A317SRP8_9PEZI|nr:hypothetical protein C7212DRAFT_315169 [Tuber magnatum]